MIDFKVTLLDGRLVDKNGSHSSNGYVSRSGASAASAADTRETEAEDAEEAVAAGKRTGLRHRAPPHATDAPSPADAAAAAAAEVCLEL